MPCTRSSRRWSWLRGALVLWILFLSACQSPSDPGEDRVPLEVSGVVRLAEEPYPARVELWDSKWSDRADDDERLLGVQSDPDGHYLLVTTVPRAFCGQLYLVANVNGLVHRDTGEPYPWSGWASVSCGPDLVVDIDVDIPEFLVLP